jgi:N utilization substance protein B
MASRRKARILAFQALYAWEASKAPVEELLALSWLDEGQRERLSGEEGFFLRSLIAGTIERIEDIDAAIEARLEHRDMERLQKVELAILRISAYALLYQKDIPASVTIDEAVEMVKEYGNEDSWRFINGVLDGIRKAQEAS